MGEFCADGFDTALFADAILIPASSYQAQLLALSFAEDDRCSSTWEADLQKAMDHPRSQFPVPVRLPTFFQDLLEHFVTGNIGKFTGNVTTFEDEETPIALHCQEQI